MPRKRASVLLALSIVAMAGLIAGCQPTVSPTPYFAKILVGPDNSDDSQRLNFIAVGRDIFLDRNKNGVPEENELLSADEKIHVSPSNSKHPFEITAKVALDPSLISESLPQRLDVLAKVASEPPYQLSAKMLMTPQPADTNWVHFGGPLKFFTNSDSDLRLQRNSTIPEQLKLFLGTAPEGSFSSDQIAQQEESTPIPMQYRTTVVIPEKQPPYPQAIIKFELDNGETDQQSIPMDQNC